MDLANQLLDEAGFEFGPDNWRRNPDGSELVIYWATTPPTTAAAETSLFFRLQNFHDLGINVQWWEDSHHAGARITEYLNSHGPLPFDLFEFGWSMGSNPVQAFIFGPAGYRSRPRGYSERMAEAMRVIQTDPRMWDTEFAIEAHREWQRAFYEFLPSFPTSMAVQIHAVNNRVWGYTTELNNNIREPGRWHMHLIGVTSEQRYVR